MTQPPGPSSGYGTGRLAVPRHVVMLGRALQQCRPRLLPFDNMGGAEVLNVSARNTTPLPHGGHTDRSTGTPPPAILA